MLALGISGPSPPELGPTQDSFVVMEALKHDPEATELHRARGSEGTGESRFQIVSFDCRSACGSLACHVLA